MTSVAAHSQAGVPTLAVNPGVAAPTIRQPAPRPRPGAAPALPWLRVPQLLLLLVLAVLVPSLSIGIVATGSAVKQARTAAEEHLHQSAQALALAVDREFAGKIAALSALVTSAEFGSGGAPSNLEPLYRQAQLIAAQTGAAIKVFRPDGSIVFSTDMPLGAPLEKVNAPYLLRQIFGADGPAVSNLIVGSVSHLQGFEIAVPVPSPNGHPTLAVGASYRAEWLHHLLAVQHLPDTVLAAITDARFYVVARSDALDDGVVGRRLRPETRALLSSSPTSLFRLRYNDGVTRVVSLNPIASAPGWLLSVSQTADSLDANWRSWIRDLMVEGGLALALGSMLALLVARRLVRPLQNLDDHARAIAEAGGVLPADGVTAAGLPQYGLAELEALRRGFAAAETAMRQRIDTERSAREALAAREAELRAVFQASPIAIVRCNEQGRLLAMNDVFRTMLGLDAERVAEGRTRWDTLTAPESMAASQRALAEAMAAPDGRSQPFEALFLRPDGDRVPVLLTIAVLDRAAGDFAAFGLDLSLLRHTEQALAESEDRWRSLAEASEEGILIHDTRGVVDANPTFWRMLGYAAPPEGLPPDLATLVAPKDLAALQTHLAQRSREPLELTAVRADGRHVPVECVGRPVVFQGRALRVTVVRDLTQRRAAQAQERELLATIDMGAFMTRDLDGTIRHWSAGCERLYGWTAQEALGRISHDLLGTRFPQPHAVVLACLQSEGEWEGDLRHTTRDGRDIVVHARKMLRHDAQGRPTVLESITDVTAQRRAETALRASEAHWHGLAEAQPGIVFETDLAGRVVFANLAFQDYAGLDEAALHGDGWLATLHPRDRGHAAGAWRAAVAGGLPFEGEYRVRAADGSHRWFLCRIVPQRDQAGRILGWTGAGTDISDIVAARDAASRDAAALEHLVEERTAALRDSEARLAESARMEALGRLAGGIAHDFNNVLQAVQGSVTLAGLRLGEDTPRTERYLGMARAAAERGSAIVGRLLAFARRSDLSAHPVAAPALLEGLAELLRATLGPAVTILVDAAPDTPLLFADQAQLETVVLNLAQNANDALPMGGTIRLSAAGAAPGEQPSRGGDGPWVRVSVADDGAGMTGEVLARVTEPFFTTKPVGKGTGLGLAMARGFAEQSGGALEIESTAGRGTVVSLWLPVAPDLSEDPLCIRDAEAAEPRRVTTLLVDDDSAVRSVLADLLGEMGHHVAQAECGEAALALMDGGLVPDLVMTDLSMPGMDGIALLREARRRRPGLPSILLTGHYEDESRARQRLADGPLAVLHKPVTARAVNAQIAALVGDAGVVASGAMAKGGADDAAGKHVPDGGDAG